MDIGALAGKGKKGSGNKGMKGMPGNSGKGKKGSPYGEGPGSGVFPQKGTSFGKGSPPATSGPSGSYGGASDSGGS